ncbi:hypothetical protein AcV5_009556 [Taiwanofungus camphoratus]|nr:hypothetical protein AcV5_009556 [Antrodia cinnamomea]KAI0943038.1 hypothetical protein AcV7_002290 [Antrodia cinnamomea]KAI0943039.1 hypothetical protein AcV7_002290 [Antrodia cinnamomea]
MAVPFTLCCHSLSLHMLWPLCVCSLILPQHVGKPTHDWRKNGIRIAQERGVKEPCCCGHFGSSVCTSHHWLKVAYSLLSCVTESRPAGSYKAWLNFEHGPIATRPLLSYFESSVVCPLSIFVCNQRSHSLLLYSYSLINMRFAFALVVLFGVFTTASAATLQLTKRQFPNCAESCLVNANLGGCNSSDDSCLCNNSAFVDSVTSCIQSSCSGSDLTNAESGARQLCEAVGVTLSASSTSGASSAIPSSTAPTTSIAPTSASVSSSVSSPAASHTQSNGAMSHSVNAFAGLAAVGAIALVL